MNTKHYQLKFNDFNQFQTEFEAILLSIGFDLENVTINAKGHLFQILQSVETIEDVVVERSHIYNLDWHPSQPKKIVPTSTDENGNIVDYEYEVDQVDSNGQPLSYVLYPGYHVELFSNQELSINPAFLVTPQIKQYRKA